MFRNDPRAADTLSRVEVFDGPLDISFSQAYVASSSDRPNDEDINSGFYRGQQNGLLGAAVDGLLFLTTGVQDGEVHLAVHVVDQAQDLDDSWEECVEASFAPETPVVAVSDWDRVAVCEIELGEETYRVRYTARGMDSSRSGEGVRESCGLWFWPSPATPDEIIRQTSAQAAYWHGAWWGMVGPGGR